MRGDFWFSARAQGLLLAVLVLASAAIWYVGIREETAILADSAARLESEDLNLSRIRQQNEALVTVLTRYQRNLDQIASFRANYLREKEARILKISSFLERAAREHHLKLEDIYYQTRLSRDKGLEIQHIELPLSGRYGDIRAFVATIESADLFLIITRLTLGEDTGLADGIRIQLSLATYFEGAPS